MNIQNVLQMLRILQFASTLDKASSQETSKTPCPNNFPVFETHRNQPGHGDVCRQQGGRNYRCPKGCYKSQMGKPPFCQKRKWNEQPCRFDYKPPTCPLFDDTTSQGPSKSPCPNNFPLFETHQNQPDHGDVCRQQGGRNYRCPKGCYKTQMGKPPFCRKRKWNEQPCRLDYKPQPCLKAKYPNFVSYHGIANHGDVCRHIDGKNYQCPAGCFKTRNGRQPFCQKARWIKRPCRFDYSREIGKTQISCYMFVN